MNIDTEIQSKVCFNRKQCCIKTYIVTKWGLFQESKSGSMPKNAIKIILHISRAKEEKPLDIS